MPTGTALEPAASRVALQRRHWFCASRNAGYVIYAASPALCGVHEPQQQLPSEGIPLFISEQVGRALLCAPSLQADVFQEAGRHYRDTAVPVYFLSGMRFSTRSWKSTVSLR